MGCPYSDEELEKWDSVCNPMGPACSECNDCECDHWAGTCEGCQRDFCVDPGRFAFEDAPY